MGLQWGGWVAVPIYAAGGGHWRLTVVRSHPRWQGKGARARRLRQAGVCPTAGEPMGSGRCLGRKGHGGLETEMPRVAPVCCAVVSGRPGPMPGCLHDCANARGFGLAAGWGWRGRWLPMVVRCMGRVAGVGCGQRRMAMGTVGGVPAMRAMVVLVGVLDVLGWVVVVVVVVGGWVLLQVAVLGMMGMCRALHGYWVVLHMGAGRARGQVGLGWGLPSPAPEQGAQEGGGVGHGLVWARWTLSC